MAISITTGKWLPLRRGWPWDCVNSAPLQASTSIFSPKTTLWGDCTGFKTKNPHHLKVHPRNSKNLGCFLVSKNFGWRNLKIHALKIHGAGLKITGALRPVPSCSRPFVPSLCRTFGTSQNLCKVTENKRQNKPFFVLVVPFVWCIVIWKPNDKSKEKSNILQPSTNTGKFGIYIRYAKKIKKKSKKIWRYGFFAVPLQQIKKTTGKQTTKNKSIWNS